MIPFFDLVPGSNVVRFITTPYQYYCHPKLSLKGKKSFEQRLKCPTILLNELKCPICVEGDRSKPRWLVGLVSRQDDKVYAIDFDYATFAPLREYARHERWGNPEKYDLDLHLDQIENKVRIIPIPNMHLPFDATKYSIDKAELAALCAPGLQDYEAIVTKNYEEVNNAHRSQDYDY